MKVSLKSTMSHRKHSLDSNPRHVTPAAGHLITPCPETERDKENLREEQAWNCALAAAGSIWGQKSGFRLRFTPLGRRKSHLANSFWSCALWIMQITLPFSCVCLLFSQSRIYITREKTQDIEVDLGQKNYLLNCVCVYVCVCKHVCVHTCV